METPSVNSYWWIIFSLRECSTVSNGLTYWNTAFCYLQLWYPVFCNELDNFWELSVHLIGQLGLKCSVSLLSLSFGAPLLTKFARELITVDESLWLHVESRVNWDTVILNACYRYISCAIVRAPFGAYCSVPGYTWDCVIDFESNPTLTACVRATWVFFKKMSKPQKTLEKDSLGGQFSILCVWQNVLFSFG